MHGDGQYSRLPSASPEECHHHGQRHDLDRERGQHRDTADRAVVDKDVELDRVVPGCPHESEDQRRRKRSVTTKQHWQYIATPAVLLQQRAGVQKRATGSNAKVLQPSDHVRLPGMNAECIMPLATFAAVSTAMAASQTRTPRFAPTWGDQNRKRRPTSRSSCRPPRTLAEASTARSGCSHLPKGEGDAQRRRRIGHHDPAGGDQVSAEVEAGNRQAAFDCGIGSEHEERGRKDDL